MWFFFQNLITKLGATVRVKNREFLMVLRVKTINSNSMFETIYV